VHGAVINGLKFGLVVVLAGVLSASPYTIAAKRFEDGSDMPR
jgi:hypothetical protein